MKWYYIYSRFTNSRAHQLLVDINPPVKLDQITTAISYYYLADEDILMLTLSGIEVEANLEPNGRAFDTYAEYIEAGGCLS